MKCCWHVEINPYAQSILAKHWPSTEKFLDIREFHGGKESVDLICGGFPCTQVSNARTAQVKEPEGLEGKDSKLWYEFERVVRELKPRWVVVENVGALSVRGLPDILRGLASAGYDAEWSVLSSSSLGAPHLRKRLFIVAISHANGKGLERHVGKILAQPKDWRQDAYASRSTWWHTEPGVRRVADGVPAGMDPPRDGTRKQRLMALGNAVVPQVSEFIGRRIMAIERAHNEP
jgi:DNA (cytosine-5)-methyltransferase 1